MNQKLHPGPHPDADQLSVFVEGADTAREREQMLTHLAQCRECRDVVFLMQGPLEAPSAKEVTKEWSWQGWFAPAALAGATLVALAVVLIYVRPWTGVSEHNRQTAVVEKSQLAAPDKPLVATGNAGPPARQQTTENGLETERARAGAAPRELRGTAAAKTPKVENRPRSVGAKIQPPETVVVTGAAATTSVAGGAQAADSLSSPTLQQLPLNGRDVVVLQPLATPPGAQPATPSDRLKAQQNLSTLLVEDQSTQNAALSGVSGRVIDPSGAAVPGATVALRDTSGRTRQIATEADGSFRVTGVPAGHYDLTVTAPGFASNQQSMDLKASQLAMLEPVLTLGSVTQEVTVSAAVQPIETDSSRVVSTAELPSHLTVASSVSLGKRVLSLDTSGSLFLSLNAGKSWKKVHSGWSGKATSLDITPADARDDKAKMVASGAESAPKVFRLTTDSGAHWTSKDGTHWRPQ